MECYAFCFDSKCNILFEVEVYFNEILKETKEKTYEHCLTLSSFARSIYHFIFIFFSKIEYSNPKYPRRVSINIKSRLTRLS